MTLDNDKLAAAKLWLTSAPSSVNASSSKRAAPSAKGAPKGDLAPRDMPYLATALYALTAVECGDVERMTCDEHWRVYINPGWLTTATVPEVGAELAHMTWHLLSDHASRARDQNVDRSTAAAWAKAADVATSHTLLFDGLCPDHLTQARDLPAPVGRSVEEYFLVTTRMPSGDQGRPAGGGSGEDTNDDSLGGCGSGVDGITRPHEYAEGADIGGLTPVDAIAIRRAVMIEYQASAKFPRGNDPGGDLRWILATLEPRMPWNQLLTATIRRAVAWASGRGEYTYSRPSRRASVTSGVILPGQRRPVPYLAVIIDTSASMDDALLEQALGEVDGALSALGIPGASVAVYSVDSAVHTSKRVRRARDAVLIGAGGTNLIPGIRAAAAGRPRPDIIIVLTDGDTPWPTSPPPACIVIAGILGRDGRDLPPTPRWAVRIECLVGG